jgi:hypothetical protein
VISEMTEKRTSRRDSATNLQASTIGFDARPNAQMESIATRSAASTSILKFLSFGDHCAVARESEFVFDLNAQSLIRRMLSRAHQQSDVI